jgi:hypothetical protein
MSLDTRERHGRRPAGFATEAAAGPANMTLNAAKRFDAGGRFGLF